MVAEWERGGARDCWFLGVGVGFGWVVVRVTVGKVSLSHFYLVCAQAAEFITLVILITPNTITDVMTLLSYVSAITMFGTAKPPI